MGTPARIIAAGGGRGHSRERTRVVTPSSSGRSDSGLALPASGRRHPRSLPDIPRDRRLLHVALQVGCRAGRVPRPRKLRRLAVRQSDPQSRLLEIALALVIAYLLYQKMRGRGIYRTVYYLPYVTSFVAAAAVFFWVFHPQYGLVNDVLGLVGIGPQRWLDEPGGIFEIAA